MDELTKAIGVLIERRNWLTARIAAKQSVGWCVQWDTRERDALSTVITAMTDAVAA